MSDTRRLLLVIGSLVCLLAVASTLPAADPRLDIAGAPPTDGAPADGGAADRQTPAEPTPRATPVPDEAAEDTTEPAILLPEPVSPDTRRELRLVGVADPSDVGVLVDGEFAGRTDDDGELVVSVPAAREMTVTALAASGNVSRTVAVDTAVQLDVDGPRAPSRVVTVNATTGPSPLSRAAVELDGERVATTDLDGAARVELPARAGPATLRVERGPFDGERTIDVAEPTLSLQSPLLFPGSFAAVRVTADGEPFPGAGVAVNGERVAQTDAAGRALIRLPLADSARVTTTVGAETATTTVTDLYLRLTAVVVLVPGLAIGGAWSLGRVLAAIEVEGPTGDTGFDRQPSGGTGDVFVLLASLLGEFADAAARLVGLFTPGPGGWSLSWPTPSWPALSLSAPSLSVPSIDGVSVSFPSLRVPTFGGWFGGDDDPEPATPLDTGDAVGGPSDTARGRRAQIRAVWHGFLDRLGLDSRATMTPGQVARRAVAEGFRAVSVWRLVETVRAVEYGDHDPTPERVATVRAAVADLLDDEGGDDE